VAEADPPGLRGRPWPLDKIATASNGSVGVVASACLEEEIVETREAPTMRGRGSQLELREEQARPFGVADRLVLLWKPGNAGRGKEPDFWRVTGRDQQSGDWLCLSTPLRTRRSRKELYLPAKMVMSSESRPMRDRAIVCRREKPVGEPCARNPHARFDERECGNGAWCR
jgi:hypothetical protein